MTERQWICFAALAMTGRALLRHCEERSDEAIHSFLWHGLLRCARNDGEAWIASRSRSGMHSCDPLARNDGEGYTVIACDKREAFAQRSAATKQSILSCGMDCFAALAMTERQWICFATLAMTGRALLRHCEERSDEAIHSFLRHGLLRRARNDGEAWIASRSLSTSARLRDPVARNDGEGYTVCLRRPAPAGKSTSSSWSRHMQVPCGKSPAASPLRQVRCGKSPDRTMTVAVVQRFGINCLAEPLIGTRSTARLMRGPGAFPHEYVRT
jgi:hypothetical protein